MKRIHLFEFEDLQWFPHWIRTHMTNMLNAVHRLLGTGEILADLLAKQLQETKQDEIIDLCSGSGGPMIDAVKLLQSKYGFENISLTLSDLYPNLQIAQKWNSKKEGIQYQTSPVDATNIAANKDGLRTMICSFHHMKPTVALQILQNAQQANQPFLLFEISDNSLPPTWLWWIALPFNFLFALVVGLFTRPFTWQQFVFTYLIPIFPIFFAWDGAVSNVRTYTESDLGQLLSQLPSSSYQWKIGKIKGTGGAKLYLIGRPLS